MPDLPISGLPDGGNILPTDQIAINRAGTTRRVVVQTGANRVDAAGQTALEGTLTAVDVDYLIFNTDTNSLLSWNGTAFEPATSETDYGSAGNLTDGASVAWDLSVTRNATISSALATVVIANPTNLEEGQVYSIILTSTNAGGTNFSFDSFYRDTSNQLIPAIAIANGELRQFTFISTNGIVMIAKSGLASATELPVKYKATTESPEAGFQNQYPVGATIGTAPAVVLGQAYSTTVVNADGVSLTAKIYESNPAGDAWLEVTESDALKFGGSLAALPATAGFNDGDRVHVNVATTDPIGFYTLVSGGWTQE